MTKTSLFLLLFCAFSLNAKTIISPMDAMKQNYLQSDKITQEDLLITDANVLKIEQNAKTKLNTKSFKIFKAAKNGKNIGYGVLIDRKIRSKNGVALYMISADSTLKAVEIIAFNEPLEYIPSKKWISQLNNTQSQNIEKVLKDVPPITGATLSAKNIIDGSSIAFAIYNEMLKGR